MSDGLLASIVADREPSALVAIHDAVDHQGRALCAALAAAHAHRGGPVFVLALERLQPDFGVALPLPDAMLTAALQAHDATEVFSHALRSLPAATAATPCLVVVDSVTPLLCLPTAATMLPSVCRGLRRLADDPRVRRVVVVVHDCLHPAPPGVAAAVDHVASTVVQLGSRGTAHVRHTRRSGKVLAEHVAYAVAPPPAWALTAGPVAAAVVPGAGAAAAAAAPAADPTKGLTFNMHQTDQSQRARQEMTLPYEKAVAGKISYEPDAGDFDDEDPDDDLDL